MHSLPRNVQKLIDHFIRLPGIGSKTASRLVLYLLHSPDYYLEDFSSSMSDLKKKVSFCKNCHNLAENDLCSICLDDSRDKSKILVIEDVLDLIAFESMGEYRGIYHVLGGVLSPISGIGPEELNLIDLFEKINNEEGLIKELIIATNPNLEGEATALYIKNHLKNNDVIISRIARGLPTGADLDYADKVTLLKSLEGRVEI